MEFGDRKAFLDRVRARQGPTTHAGPHPPPPAPDVVPEIRYRVLDGVDDAEAMLDVFVRAARGAEADVEVVEGGVPDGFVAGFVSAHGIRSAVLSREADAQTLGPALRSAGVAVGDYTPDAAASADLAVTGATHGLASTGSVVVDSHKAGSRAVSLLPPIHLCVLRAHRILPTHAELFRRSPRTLPSCRVVITGPSRTGDIEQRLILGAHGPVRLQIVLVR